MPMPEPTPSALNVTVHGYPAAIVHDTVNHRLEVTWHEPGGIELRVRVDDATGQHELLKLAEGLRQP